MECSTTITFRTLVQVSSTLPTPPPTAVPSTPSAINNLAKLPAPLWGVILVVVTFLCGGIFFFFFSKKKKKEEKGEEGAEAPANTEEIPLDDLTPDVPSPQAALTADWLRARQAGDNSRPLRVLVEPRGPNVAQPAADSLTVDEGVKFVPVPPGYGAPASGRPASRARPSRPATPTTPARRPDGSRASEAASPRLISLDPAGAAAITTSLRNAGHGGRELVGWQGGSLS